MPAVPDPHPLVAVTLDELATVSILRPMAINHLGHGWRSRFLLVFFGATELTLWRRLRHAALAQLERRVPRFTLVTQNVHGLHRRAGSGSVIELHGDIARTKCSVEDVIVEDFGPEGTPPAGPNCGAFLRPDVVWFGEALPADALGVASEAAHSCDVFFSIGTSGLVQPAASLPFEALRSGATVVEINLDETPLTRHADHLLQGRAGEVLPALVKAVYGDLSR